MSNVERALDHYETHKIKHLNDLKDLVRIPSCGFPGFSPEQVERSAQATAALLKKSGFENVEVIKIGDAHPYVYGDWLHAPDKPTLLLYAHHDVQPPGREHLWKTPPYEPVEKNGRLWGRGTADDKAGIVIHTATVASYLQATGKLPVNVKVVIEGEEEIGSTHLGEFLEKYKHKVKADILVLTDTGNFDSGVPALTTSLRGLVAMNVEVKALERPVHSGMWGGPTPDPTQALVKMLATMTDTEGRLSVPGLWDEVRRLSAVEESALADLPPLTDPELRHQAGLRPSTRALPSRDGTVRPYLQMWREPSFSINAFEAGSRKAPANIICDSAWAHIGIRIVPDMDPARTARLVEEHLRRVAPWGVEVHVEHDSGAASAWGIRAEGKVYDLALKALEKGYGAKAVLMGSGGTIPFVGPFAEALGGAPALLIGVEDPYTNAHSENESMLISDFEKSIKSMIHFYADLAVAN